MITCERCSKVLLTIQESSELYVRGEVKLVVLCQSCSHVNYVVLYEYNKDRMNGGAGNGRGFGSL
jgi:RNase P subunit RPR2